MAPSDRPADSEPIIRIEGVSKSFGGVPAVADVSIDIARGDFFCLVGASGSGKTTLLRLLAGFETPERGRILIGGEDMTGRAPYERPVNMMFQSYALFPHLSVHNNVAFGLREERLPKAEINSRVAAALGMFDMGAFAGRKPHQLSGGQRQRVALARALVKNPKILLLDEPLAALDKKLREQAQLELVALRERVGITFIMVTHDQEEAMSIASHIALMRNGAVIQIGTPRELYERPASRYAADFFGAANLFDGQLAGGDGAGARVECAAAGASIVVADAGSAAPGPVTVLLRPEQVGVYRTPPDERNVLSARVTNIIFLGNSHVCHAALDSGMRVQARISPADMARLDGLSPGDPVHLSWPPSAGRILPP